MTTHDTYQPYGSHHRQNHGGNSDPSNTQNHGNYANQGTSVGPQSYGGQPGNGIHPGFPHASQSFQNAGQYYAQGPYPYPKTDMQYMIQMMVQLGNQLGHLACLIEQNNVLLQSIHDKEDTKCVQGAGGGAVIVRM